MKDLKETGGQSKKRLSGEKKDEEQQIRVHTSQTLTNTLEIHCVDLFEFRCVWRHCLRCIKLSSLLKERVVLKSLLNSIVLQEDVTCATNQLIKFPPSQILK